MSLLRIFHRFKKKKSFKVIPGVFPKGFIALQNHVFQHHLKDVFGVERLINLPHPEDCVDTPRETWWMASLLLQPSLKAEAPALQMKSQVCCTFASQGKCLLLLSL